MSTVEQAQARMAAAIERLRRATDAMATSRPDTLPAEAAEALRARAEAAEAEVERLKGVNAAIAAKLDQAIARVEAVLDEAAAP